MDMFLKTLQILLLITATSTINAQLQQPINTAPSTPPLFKTSDLPNIFASQPSPTPAIGVNGRGIFTGAPLASRRGPIVTLHSYPWLTYNKLVNAEDKSGRTLVYNEDTSFALPSQPLSSSIANIPSIPSIPGIPNPPKLPNFPTFPTPVTLRKPRSIITPQINQTQFPGIVQFGNSFPTHPYSQFPIYPLPYPIPYTIITQVIPAWPIFGVPYQPPPMPMVSGEASGAIVTPEIETGGEFSGGAEIEAPYPDPVEPDSEAAGEFVGEAEIEGPYPDPVLPEVSGEAIGEAMLAPYPAASPESAGDATLTGPYPASLKPDVSGEASGGATIEGPYPAEIQPEVNSEKAGPYPVAKPVVSGEASGSATIVGPYPAAIPVKTSKVRAPNPAPARPGFSGVATLQGALPVTVKPPGEISTETLKEFILLKEFMAGSKKPAVTTSGEKRKGPYLIPKPSAAGADLGSLTKPVVPTARRGDRVSYAARLREVVYPEYLRDATGRVVRFN